MSAGIAIVGRALVSQGWRAQETGQGLYSYGLSSYGLGELKRQAKVYIVMAYLVMALVSSRDGPRPSVADTVIEHDVLGLD